MALQDVLLNAGLAGMSEIIGEVSLHSADPGASGTDEVDTERQTPTWSAPTSATVAIDGILTFEVPGGGTVVSWVGLWDAADVFLGGIQLNASETFEGDGQFAVTSLTISAANA